MVRKLLLAALFTSIAFGTATAQNARTVITNAQRALGNVDSISYTGSAHYVAFQSARWA